MYGYKSRRRHAVLAYKLGKIFVVILAILALLMFLIVVIKALPNNHPIPLFQRLADLIDIDGSVALGLKSNPALVVSTVALLLSVAGVINTFNSKASFNIRDVSAANRFTDWCTPWVLRWDALTTVAVRKAEAFRAAGNHADFRSVIDLTVSVADEISLHLGDGKSSGSDFRYVEARPLFDSETLDAFLAAASKTKAFAVRYKNTASTVVVDHIDRIDLLRDVEGVADALSHLVKHLLQFSEGKWKNQAAH